MRQSYNSGIVFGGKRQSADVKDSGVGVHPIVLSIHWPLNRECVYSSQCATFTFPFGGKPEKSPWRLPNPSYFICLTRVNRLMRRVVLVIKHARQTVPRCFGHFLGGERRLTKTPEALLVTPWSLVSLISGPTNFQHRPPSSHEQIILETVAFAEGSSSLHPFACPFPPSASKVSIFRVPYRPTLFCALRNTTHVHRRP